MSMPPVRDPSAKSGRASPGESDTSDDGATVSRPPDAARGTWGALEILEEIGHGGFGRVYRAWEPTLAREVALKIIRPSDGQTGAASAILHEGRVLARVHHPNVVTIHGAQQVGPEVGLWMEFVRGRTLAQIVAADGPRAAGEAALIGVTLCQALAAVHQTGVVHRDVKANNVMREAGGRIVLMDFGAGELLAAPGTGDRRQIGTPVYMAPEVLTGSPATPRSDIYSLGILLYFLVTGRFPVEGRTWTDFVMAHARSERRPLADLRPDLPARFVHVVERATRAHAEERYATPGSMLRDLAEIAVGDDATTGARQSPGTTPARDTDSLPVRAPRWRIVAGVATVMVVIWVFGGITSYVFNHTLRRGGGFADESILGWWLWGFKALIPGAIYVTMLVLLWWMVAAIGRLVARIAPPLRRTADWIRVSRGAAVQRLGLDDPDTAAHAFLAMQVGALLLVCWFYRDLLGAVMTFVDAASPADIEPLRPIHVERHQNYNLTIALLILAGVLGARRVLSLRQRAGVTNARSPLAAICAVIAASFVLLVFPYRLMWHNERELARYSSRDCYVLGERANDVLLYCPSAPSPKTAIVNQADPQLHRSAVVENIYTR